MTCDSEPFQFLRIAWANMPTHLMLTTGLLSYNSFWKDHLYDGWHDELILHCIGSPCDAAVEGFGVARSAHRNLIH